MRNQFRAWAESDGRAMTEAEVARFLYHEARLLDEKRWDEWFALFTDDALLLGAAGARPDRRGDAHLARL